MHNKGRGVAMDPGIFIAVALCRAINGDELTGGGTAKRLVFVVWKTQEMSMQTVSGEDFMALATTLMRSHFSVPEDVDVKFCCSVEGAPNLFEFCSSRAYWRAARNNFIYVWFGLRPDLEMKNVYAEIAATRRQIALLKEKICPPHEWALRQCEDADKLSLEAVEFEFRPRGEASVQTKVSDVVQALNDGGRRENWTRNVVAALSKAMGSGGTFAECGKDGVYYAGQQLRVNFVISTRPDVVAAEFMDTPMCVEELNKMYADQQTFTLRLMKAMSAMFDAQPLRCECWGVALRRFSVVFVRCILRSILPWAAFA